MIPHKEIERRYLFKPIAIEGLRDLCADSWREEKISQYYLKAREDGAGERYRKKGDRYWHTIKRGEGMVRLEEEELVTEDEFLEHKKDANGITIEKFRYTFDLEDTRFELDRFLDDLHGLWILEVEFNGIEEASMFSLPEIFRPVVIAEVTADSRFSNANLSSIGTVPSVNDSVLSGRLDENNAYLLSTRRVLGFWMGHHGERAASSVSSDAFRSDFEMLHDARTSIRRILSYLELFQSYFDSEWASNLRGRIKRFMSGSGKIRDVDVMLEALDNYGTGLPGKLKKQLKKLKKRIRRERKEKLAKFHESIMHAKDLVDVEPIFNENATVPLYIVLPGILDRYLDTLFARISEIDKKSPDKHYHKMRILIKRLRYLVEMSRVYIESSKYEKIYDYLVETQTALGEFHDLCLQRKKIKGILESEKRKKRGVMSDLLKSLETKMKKRAKKMKRYIRLLLSEIEKNDKEFRNIYIRELSYGK